MPRGLVLTAPRALAYEELLDRPLQAGEVRLRSIVSGISHGTELNLYRGTSPFADRMFDPELRVFVPGNGTSAATIRLGYDLVGEVVEVGDGVSGVAVGDLLHTGESHREESIIRLDSGGGYPPIRLPDRRANRGLFVSLASVALQAVHDARIKVGDAVVVSGAGVIGLLVLQLAKINGGDPIIVVEPQPTRRRLATELGATAVIDPAAVDRSVGDQVKRVLAGRGADVAIETSGTYSGLHGSIASVGVGGTVVAAGFYQGGGADLRLGEEWHHNRPTMVSSMGVWDCPHRDHPLWDRDRMMRTAVDLIYSERLIVDPLLTETLPFAEAESAYRRLDRDPGTALKIALTYRE